MDKTSVLLRWTRDLENTLCVCGGMTGVCHRGAATTATVMVTCTAEVGQRYGPPGLRSTSSGGVAAGVDMPSGGG